MGGSKNDNSQVNKGGAGGSSKSSKAGRSKSKGAAYNKSASAGVATGEEGKAEKTEETTVAAGGTEKATASSPPGAALGGAQKASGSSPAGAASGDTTIATTTVGSPSGRAPAGPADGKGASRGGSKASAKGSSSSKNREKGSENTANTTSATNSANSGGTAPPSGSKAANAGRSKSASGGSKARNTGKALSSLSKFNDSYALIFPNALPVKQVMWGLDPLNKVWRFCSIVYARPKNKNLNDLNFIFPLNLTKNEIITKLSTELSTNTTEMNEWDYDYYVHWEKFDRRLDCWLAYKNLRCLDQEPNDGLPCIREKDNEESDHDDHAGIDKEYLREHEENTKLKTINQIKFGKYLIDTWYFSPYPKEYQNIDILYICEFCLSFFKENEELLRHTEKCEIRHPPGNEIYRCENISIFEIDGTYFRIYCENLCFLSKLFLDHKTLKHRVNLFLFYVITEFDHFGYHITGYFSKEKYSKNNVSCILTLPQHQKKGYGRFLINFSYFLSQTEKRTGTPERPLSDLGVASYMAYWYETLLKVLINYEQLSIQELSEITSIETNDIISCLEEKDIFKTLANGGESVYYINPQQLEFVLAKVGKKNYDLCPTKLHWVSYDYYLAM
ncbi:histone acetyltransferase [Plasmodium inui San Antonio 1]|uniref:Histone acetyltransferase n=1 Tax=Plasmodium inui San Antonio 1 TaxID=1237626 RepID=W7AJE3_9APIC|nr:histone acetyltransferase [Plasmodium inui San Antonio 1]EUD65456.1 histone acetyltransferase [Plasmodium inui San Antonio 1]